MLFHRVSVVRAAVDGYGGAQGDGAVFVTSSRRTRRRRKDPNDAIEALREAVSCLMCCMCTNCSTLSFHAWAR